MRRQTMCALGTGVQTCALPIYRGRGSEVGHLEPTQCLAGRFCGKAADKERARATGSERGKTAELEAISPTWVCRIPEHINNGRSQSWARVCQYVYISVVHVVLNNNMIYNMLSAFDC